MDRLEAMSVLLTAIESGSFSAAGRRIGKPLTTISRKVLELEEHLNVRLLNRSGRQLTLTDAGRSYAEACRQILEQVREAERTASGEYAEPKGELVVSAPMILGRVHVLPVVSDFLKAYPRINVQVLLSDRMTHLMGEEVDFAVQVSELPDSSLIATRVGLTRRVICGSPAYFKAKGDPMKPRDLAAHDCVTISRLMSSDAWSFMSGASEIVVPILSRLVVNTAEAALDAAIAGVGVTCALSFQIGDTVKAGLLEVVLQEFEPTPVPINLIYAGGRFLPQKVRAFSDFAAPRLRASLARAEG